jgi:hypothetical protein
VSGSAHIDGSMDRREDGRTDADSFDRSRQPAYDVDCSDSTPIPRTTSGRLIGPTPAEQARTTLWVAPPLCVRTGTAHEAVDEHGTSPDGSPILIVPHLSALAESARGSRDPVGVVVDTRDVSPVPTADRTRHRVRLTGLMHEPPVPERRAVAGMVLERESAGAVLGISDDAGPAATTVLCIEVAQVLLAAADPSPGRQDRDSHGFPDGATSQAARIDLDDFSIADPDPLATAEGDLLSHLLLEHPGELALMRALLPRQLTARAHQVRPVGIDRYGLMLRVTSPSQAHDVRLAFRRPVTTAQDLPEQMRELLYRAAESAETTRSAGMHRWHGGGL